VGGPAGHQGYHRRCDAPGQKGIECRQQYTHGTQERTHRAHCLYITSTKLSRETKRQEDRESREHTGRADNRAMPTCSHYTQSHCHGSPCDREAVRDSSRAHVQEAHCAYEPEETKSPYAWLCIHETSLPKFELDRALERASAP